MDNNEWKDRVLDQLVVNNVYKREHEDNPKMAVDDLIASVIYWERVQLPDLKEAYDLKTDREDK